MTQAVPPHIKKSKLIRHATDVIEAIEYAIQLRQPDNDPFGTYDEFISLRDCEFPWHIDDPLQIVRVMLGNDYAERLEYEDHLEGILADIELCRNKLLGGDCGADEASEGDSQGEESDNSQDC
jgi:hypothetical protein